MYHLQMNDVQFAGTNDPKVVINQIKTQKDHKFGVVRVLKDGQEIYSDYWQEENFKEKADELCDILSGTLQPA